jgi:transcriptional regulator with XRE-family HTH domain
VPILGSPHEGRVGSGDVSDDAWQARMTALGAFIRAERSAAGLSLRDLAARAELSNAYLSQVERGRHAPSIKVLKSVADALGLPLVALLEEADLVDGRNAPPDAEAAIRGDPRLSEPQRTAMLSIYRSFVPRRNRRR